MTEMNFDFRKREPAVLKKPSIVESTAFNDFHEKSTP